jgi:hypothetical protein
VKALRNGVADISIVAATFLPFFAGLGCEWKRVLAR